MLTFGIPIYGENGELGKLSGVVIDPKEREARWLIVTRSGALWDKDSRLIAPKHIQSQDKKGLHLKQTQWDFSVSQSYLRMNDRRVGVAPDHLVLASGIPVRGTDGFIGKLKGVALDADNRRLTQLHIKGEWILGEEWVVPVDWADVISDKEIHLNRSRRVLRDRKLQSTPMTPASSRA